MSTNLLQLRPFSHSQIISDPHSYSHMIYHHILFQMVVQEVRPIHKVQNDPTQPILGILRHPLHGALHTNAAKKLHSNQFKVSHIPHRYFTKSTTEDPSAQYSSNQGIEALYKHHWTIYLTKMITKSHLRPQRKPLMAVLNTSRYTCIYRTS